jgi:plasmid stability protein
MIAKQFLLRLPDGMHERISRDAAANHRSMNAEIIHRLVSTMTPDRAPEEIPNPADDRLSEQNETG